MNKSQTQKIARLLAIMAGFGLCLASLTAQAGPAGGSPTQSFTSVPFRVPQLQEVRKVSACDVNVAVPELVSQFISDPYCCAIEESQRQACQEENIQLIMTLRGTFAHLAPLYDVIEAGPRGTTEQRLGQAIYLTQTAYERLQQQCPSTVPY